MVFEQRPQGHSNPLPDATLAATRDAAEQTRVDAVQRACDADARKAMASDTARLAAIQTKSDTPEALATIPALGLDDLPRENATIPRQVIQGDNTVLTHELPTRGIAYATFLLPLNNVPEELVPLIPLFARSLTETGTARRDFTALGALLAARTGGLSADPLMGAIYGSRAPLTWLSITGKAVYDKLPDLMALVNEILLEPLQDGPFLTERLHQMLLEDKARLEHGLQAAGHATVSARLRAHFNGADALAERTAGLTYLESVRALLARLENDATSLLVDLNRLRAHIVARPGAVFDCVAENKGLALAIEQARQVLTALPTSRPGKATGLGTTAMSLPTGEVFLAPAQINYVGKASNLYDLGYAYHGSATVILRALRMGYLWEHVRVRGGAYGAFCGMDRLVGTLTCASYRDPNVHDTLDAFDGMADYLRTFTPDKAQLTQAIVGAVGDLDAYLLPDAKGARSLTRWLTHDTDDLRARMREEMLGTTATHFRQFADVLAAAKDTAAVCVLGGSKAEAAAAANGWACHHLL